MHQGRCSLQLLIEYFPEPERTLHRRQQRRHQQMGDEATIVDLRRQITEMQRAATANAAALLASEAAKEELKAKVNTIPKSAFAYMRPEILAPVSPVVLPNIRVRHFELKTSFLAMLKDNAYSGNPTNTD